MIELIAAISGILFGAIGSWILVRQHVRSLRKEWKEQLEDEKKRHAEANVKAYAAERDFQHLERHLGQNKEAIKLLQDELEEMKANQIEMRTLLNASYNQMQAISHNLGGGTTGGWGKPQ